MQIRERNEEGIGASPLALGKERDCSQSSFYILISLFLVTVLFLLIMYVGDKFEFHEKHSIVADYYSAPSLWTSVRSFGFTAMSLTLTFSDVKSKGGFPTLLKKR